MKYSTCARLDVYTRIYVCVDLHAMFVYVKIFGRNTEGSHIIRQST